MNKTNHTKRVLNERRRKKQRNTNRATHNKGEGYHGTGIGGVLTIIPQEEVGRPLEVPNDDVTERSPQNATRHVLRRRPGILL